MGQQIFIPHSGDGGGGNAGSVFLSRLYDAGNNVDYGFALPGGGANLFYGGGDFTAVVAFRVVKDNSGAITIPVLTVVDDAGTGWSFFINSSNRVCAQVDGQNLVPDTSDLPLGRVFIATLTHAAGGDTNLYINGRFLANTSAPQPAVTAPVSLLAGGSSWDKDYLEYIGLAFFSDKVFTADEVAAGYISSQDAGLLAFPPGIITEESYVLYNADGGLTNLALWVPEANTIAAPSLPAIPGGLPTGALLTAPFHVAHSGWSDEPPA